MNLGAPELLIVLLVLVVIFGPAKLPKLARSIGQAAGEFRRGHEHPDPAPMVDPDDTVGGGDASE